MANLTIVIDDDLLRRARVRAAEQGTSVNAVLRAELIRYADSASSKRATASLLAHAQRRQTPGTGSGAAGRNWTRDELYEERVGGRPPGR